MIPGACLHNLFAASARLSGSKARRVPTLIASTVFLSMFCGFSANAQIQINPPTEPVITNETPAIEPPTEIGPISTIGETPYNLSEPPTGYEPQVPPEVSVTGGVDVPVTPGNPLKLDADLWHVEFEEGQAVLITATGQVRATYQGYTITSDSAIADLKTRLATFKDNVVLSAFGQEVHGTSVSLNLDTRAWRFENATSTVLPDMFPDIIRAPVYLKGDVITGGRLADQIKVEHGSFTTCNLDHPHYLINAKQVSIWPERKLIARDAAFYALGRHIIGLSRIAVPLRQFRERQNLSPQVGMTEEEGFFVKTAYTLAATYNNTGNLKLDLMSKKGVGYGYEDNYNLKTASGNLYIYQLNDQNQNQNTLTGRLSHNQKLGTINAALISDYRANSFLYSPGSTSLSDELRLTRDRTNATTHFGIRNTLNRGFGKYTSITSNLQHNQIFSEKTSALFGFDYYRNANPSSVNDSDLVNSQLVSKVDFAQVQPKFDWHLRISEIADLSDEAFIQQTGNRFAGTESLPELALTTDNKRLNLATPYGIPLGLDLAVGFYREDLGRVETERVMADISSDTRTYKLADRLSLSAGGGFRQYVYGDDTAQYSINASTELNQKIGSKSSAALSYRYLRPRGFSPFRFDFIGNFNVLNARVNIQETSKFKFSLFTGYNFGQDDFPWQDITLRATYAPSDKFLFYTGTGYNLSSSKWRSLINQFRVRLDNNFKLDIGSRYDLAAGKWATIKTQIDTPIGKNWHARVNTSFNGYTHTFDYNNFQLVRDLHCWEMSFSWVDQNAFWQEQGFMINLRIKAFPIFDNFGVGQQGQAIDTAVGQVL